ncbi:zinc ion binding [Striga asiatica]|uniref:Zinc ion binding n=1 Tax=Striga asiatica TaxID=4170 RepID=A0A5A7P631_STRAF|nr:zinc ion binding [Striga asiatica]
MDVSKKITEEAKIRETAMSSFFCRRIYSEVEEIGWEHLVKLSDDMTFLSFRLVGMGLCSVVLGYATLCCMLLKAVLTEIIIILNFSKLECFLRKKSRLENADVTWEMTMDNAGRSHVLEIELDKTYPRSPPSVSVDIPHNLDLEWSSNSKLRDVVHQFQQLLDLHCDAGVPKKLRYFLVYPQPNDNWSKDKSFAENLACILNTQLPLPPHQQKNEEQIECGICYAQFLPVDDELGAKSGSATDYRCENGSCNRAFHIVCIVDWLRSITTTRQYVMFFTSFYFQILVCGQTLEEISSRSFDVLFGNCPYCSDPIAVKISTNK